LLAVLKTGAAYLPLDPDYPQARLKFMVEDAGPALILTSTRAREDVRFAARILEMNDPRSMQALQACPAGNPTDADRIVPLRPSHPVYVMYTSGSTGQPKGVVMRGSALRNLLAWHAESILGAAGATVAQFTALSFDVAAQEILSALTSGKTLALTSTETRRDPAEMGRWIARNNLTELYAPNLVIQALCEFFEGSMASSGSLAHVVQAGEPLTLTDHVREFFNSRKSAVRLHNHYGPTETHVATGYTLPTDPAAWPKHAPIGQPIWNTTVYVLDSRLRPVPPGVRGELYIGGAAVARGYLKRPGLTAQRFVADPYGSPGERIYRTGDIAWRRPDGILVLDGRGDRQVKIRGFRVELGEIEAALGAIKGVAQCAVAAHDDPGLGRRLVAYIVLSPEASGVEALRAYAARTLPDYMTPAIYVRLESLPLLPNGKLDRRALPAPAEAAKIAHAAFIAPGSQMEEVIAEVWREKLNLETVSVNDNFFDVGGHSMLALQVHTELRLRTGKPLLLTDLFRYPTVSALAGYLSKEDTQAGNSAIPSKMVGLKREKAARRQRRLESGTTSIPTESNQ